MKKTKVIRIVCLVAMCALLSSCVMTGMFAKYATQDSGNDTATAAKWGVTVSASSSAFSKKYVAGVGNDSATANLEVASTADVIAPGTEGTLLTGAVTGTPEVAVHVTVEAELKIENWKVGDPEAEYCPLEFTVGNTTYKMDDTYNTIAKLIAAVEAELAVDADFAPGTNLATDVGSKSVSWKWAFTGNDDEKDTLLGNKAASGTAPSISISYTAKVEQIDTYTTPTESQTE